MLEFDLVVAEGVTWFVVVGTETVKVPIEVR